MTFVIIVLNLYSLVTAILRMVSRVSDDVLLDTDGLPKVLALAVPLLILLAGWLEGIILRSFSLKYFFSRALLHG